jgi:protein SCO1/2
MNEQVDTCAFKRIFQSCVITCAIILVSLTVVPPVSLSAKAQDGSANIRFELKDQNGQNFNDRDLAGKPTLMFFGFTHCPDICPTYLSSVGAALDDLGSIGQQLNVIFVTLDPQRDTSAVLKAYLRSFHHQIVGLTGSIENVDELAQSVGATFERRIGDDGQTVVDHTIFGFLLTRQNQLIGKILIGHGASLANTSKQLRKVLLSEN